MIVRLRDNKAPDTETDREKPGSADKFQMLALPVLGRVCLGFCGLWHRHREVFKTEIGLKQQ